MPSKKNALIFEECDLVHGHEMFVIRNITSDEEVMLLKIHCKILFFEPYFEKCSIAIKMMKKYGRMEPLPRDSQPGVPVHVICRYNI